MEEIQPPTPGQLNGGTTRKREEYLEWPEYFMAVAFLSAQRSKDPSSQVGACIVNQENKIVGIGYNGMPNGCDDDLLPWSRSADDRLDTKYPYVCHAELNAIMNKNSADVKGCTMYVALFPCNECAKLIIQAGIRDVVFLSDKYHDTPEMVASRRLLSMAGIQCRFLSILVEPPAMVLLDCHYQYCCCCAPVCLSLSLSLSLSDPNWSRQTTTHLEPKDLSQVSAF
ncbi:deoxycytidylate deaminase isoform X2 [Dicentrarchus labrax]|uniref:deoxycytidylate deaminase isoform X2 n=1 Tax=Dicentrarchus labrax TaxID=13489 RepID=UPI0021F56C8E|nr:deoxycytidylate deaminase isoform X2 [Dicentrarchus labrax]